MTTTYNDKTDTCPKCLSTQWKSAKLVILEGTSSTEGTLSGEIVEKGRLTGSPRDLFLADRWFSYESPLDASYSSSTTSSLVDAIKDMLVEEAETRPMPSPPELLPIPAEPKEPKVLARDQGKFFAQNPNDVKRPTPPSLPADMGTNTIAPKPLTVKEAIRANLYKSYVIFGVVSLALTYTNPGFIASIRNTAGAIFNVYPNAVADNVYVPFQIQIPPMIELFNSLQLSEQGTKYFHTAIFLFIFSLLILTKSVITAKSTIIKKQKVNQQKLEKMHSRQKEIQEKYEQDYKKYEEKLESWNKDIAQFKVEREEYEKLRAQYPLELSRINRENKKRQSNYDAAVTQINAFRAELWDRARLCTRCGHVYLGPRNIRLATGD